MYVSVAGLPIQLGKTGKAFLVAFAKYQGKKASTRTRSTPRRSAQIMLGRSPTRTSRLSVVRNVFRTKVTTASWARSAFDRKGDICPTRHQLLRREGHHGGLQLRGCQQGHHRLLAAVRTAGSR